MGVHKLIPQFIYHHFRISYYKFMSFLAWNLQITDLRSKITSYDCWALVEAYAPHCHSSCNWSSILILFFVNNTTLWFHLHLVLIYHNILWSDPANVGSKKPKTTTKKHKKGAIWETAISCFLAFHLALSSLHPWVSWIMWGLFVDWQCNCN